jgi:hypothetical protein
VCAGIHLYLHLPAIHAYTNGNSYAYTYTYFDTETFTDAKSCANA